MSSPRETQAERTALAWQRTASGVVAVAALMGSRAVVGGHPALLVPAGVCALLGLALLGGVGAVRDRTVRERTERGEPVAAGGPAALATAVVVVVALAAAASVLGGRLP